MSGRLAYVALVALTTLACGKKGPPLAPLARVPGKVEELVAQRSGTDVYLSMLVPVANVGGDKPADIVRLEIYGVTAERPPELKAGIVPANLTLVAGAAVRPPAPPNATAAATPTAADSGLDQGQRATFREALGPELLQAAATGATRPQDQADASARPPLSVPAVFMDQQVAAQRYYAASALSRRGRRGAWSAVRGAPVAHASGAPSASAPTYDASGITVSWTPATDAHLAPSPTGDGLLESRALGPQLPATTYNVYAAENAVASETLAGTVVRPVPLNAAPLESLHYDAAGVTFGRERCFVVRGLDVVGGATIEGPPSALACVTPEDTFPPSPPAALEAVGGAGVISLIWEGVDAPDLAGYLVFRGQTPGEATTQLTPAPIRDASFEDRTVTPGVRYVYVVVAIDSAKSANRSAPSNRAEETARQ